MISQVLHKNTKQTLKLIEEHKLYTQRKVIEFFIYYI